MIRVFGIFKILVVTVHTGRPDRIKPNLTIRLVTFRTVYCFMYAHKREGGFIVHFGDVLYDPTLRTVTACTIISHRLIVHVLVASNAG